MREAALARRFDVVLVNDLSRLSRSNGDLSTLLDRLVSKGIRVIGVQDGYDTARRGHKLQAGLSGIIGEAFRDMIRDRTHAALESRAKDRRPTGGKAYGYRGNTVFEPEAAIVREVFEKFVAGSSYRSIARELNARTEASPGAGWARKVRRRQGWMVSAVRMIVTNPRYTGLIRWNTSQWLKEPDSGKRLRRARPRSEWQEYREEGLRIIPDTLFAEAQRHLTPNKELKRGGKSRYRLSGLLRCGLCRAHYVLSNANGYSCSGYLGGHCSNGARVRRDHVENEILTPIHEDILAPDRVARMAVRMERLFAEQARDASEKADAAPAELQALDLRLARLRERLVGGDPDMESDELQAAIDRAETKRHELTQTTPAARESAKVLAMLPRAAEEFRRQIAMGVDADPEAAQGAREALRKMIPDNIRLMPEPDGGLFAEYELSPGALLQGVGTGGSGGALHAVSTAVRLDARPPIARGLRARQRGPASLSSRSELHGPRRRLKRAFSTATRDPVFAPSVAGLTDARRAQGVPSRHDG